MMSAILALIIDNEKCFACGRRTPITSSGLCAPCNAAALHVEPLPQRGTCQMCGATDAELYESDYKPREFSACFRHAVIETARHIHTPDYSHVGDPRNIA